ncbi:Gag-Pol polyprotein [Gossypium australe]|uniref:Gag-Pol polyprotein n=1 Tax=Gossypium australe TaxID=47621 RepID=A0A5B6X1E2_9ROSI|nr:Gag-Pol polyprotein [Gossypium australe]
MAVTEYEREFVRLSKYAREYVSTEEIICNRFERVCCTLSFLVKEIKRYFNRSTISSGYSNRDYGRQYTNPKAQATSVSSVGNVKDTKPECQQYGRQHFGDCWVKNNNRACYSCGSRDHFIKDCHEMVEKDRPQNVRPSNMSTRGRPLRNAGNVSGS